MVTDNSVYDLSRLWLEPTLQYVSVDVDKKLIVIFQVYQRVAVLAR